MTRLALALLALGALYMLGRRPGHARRPGAPVRVVDPGRIAVDTWTVPWFGLGRPRRIVTRRPGAPLDDAEPDWLAEYRDTWADPPVTSFRIIARGRDTA